MGYVMRWVDLHVHSNKSDGTLSPTELVSLARRIGLSAFALTDHDSTQGVEEAVEAGRGCGVEVIPGIEVSTEYDGTDVHIVGLAFDWKSPVFQERLTDYRMGRERRNQQIIARMQEDGIDISEEKLCRAFPGAVRTRAHLARYLMEHGYVSSIAEAFERYLGEDCPYYVPRRKVSPCEATGLIRACGGVAVLAHPFQYHFEEEKLCGLLEELCAAGLTGIEVYYSGYSETQTAYLRSIASRYGLLPGGGSDFHGANKPEIMLGTGTGNLHIPYEIWEALRDRK